MGTYERLCGWGETMCIINPSREWNVSRKKVWKVVANKHEPAFWYPRHVNWTIEEPNPILLHHSVSEATISIRLTGVSGGISCFETKQEANQMLARFLKHLQAYPLGVTANKLEVRALKVSGYVAKGMWHPITKDDGYSMLIAEKFISWYPRKKKKKVQKVHT